MHNTKSYKLDELYDFLKQFHLTESLYHLGAINSALKYGYKSVEAKNISPGIINWLNGMTEIQRMQVSFDATRLSRFLTLSRANDYKSKVLYLGSKMLERALEMVGNLYDHDVESGVKSQLDSSKLLGRISSWQMPLQVNRMSIIGRGFLLFVLLAEKYREVYDIDANMKEVFGMTSYSFMATGFALWLMTNGILDYELLVEIEPLKQIVTLKSQKQFLTLSSGTAKDYRTLMRGADWCNVKKLNEIYGLDAFTRMPAIYCERGIKLRHGTYIVPQPKYLLDRASSGMFYLLADFERERAMKSGKHGENPFRKTFGEIYRDYVALQLDSSSSTHTFIDLDKELFVYSGKKPDFALIKDNICVLFEVKTSLLKIEARTYFEEDTLRSEVQAGSFKKAIRQLREFREAIFNKQLPDSRFEKVSRIISIMIGYEEVYVLNSSLLPLIEEYFPELSIDLQLGCIQDIETMGTIISEGNNLSKLLVEKIDGPDRYSSIDAYTINNLAVDANPIIKKAFNDFIESMIKHGMPLNNIVQE